MASPVQQTNVSRDAAVHFLRGSGSKTASQKTISGCSGVTALSVEFVAKPQEAHRVQSAIPAALAGALQDVSGFAGCLVMISEEEARLVTVITLWVGDDRVRRCRENARWVQKLLTPYLDRCLRVQFLATHSAVPSLAPFSPTSDSECSLTRILAEEDETVCVA